MSSSSPWPVRTDRLLLRASTPDDATAMFHIRSRPGVTDWITRAFPTRASFDDWFANRPQPPVIVELDGPTGRQVIGDLMVRRGDAWAQHEVADDAAGVEIELGWVFDPAFGGRGYATEAVQAAIDVSFDVIGVRRVVAHCFADNTASWRLMERVGMRRETHTVRESLHRSGRWLDGYSYAILADERAPRAH